MSHGFMNVTRWIFESEAITKNTTATSRWYDVSVLQGAQFFIKTVSAGNNAEWTVTVHISPVMKSDQERAPADFYEAIAVASENADQAGKWYDPPSEMDRPHGQVRFVFEEDGDVENITSADLTLCGNDT